MNSYSIYVEKNDKILPKEVYTWVPDDVVTKCHYCNKKFTLFFRKHHCRSCGKIFCYNCINFYVTCLKKTSKSLITRNEYIQSHQKYTKELKNYKVCEKCYNIYIKFE